MADHEKHGAALRDAVARGDLDGTRREANVLADLAADGSLDPAWRQKLDAMTAAADRIAKAPDLREASRDLGPLVTTCADCHSELGRPKPPVVGSPEDRASDVRSHMRRHEWAAAQLWNGLVIPSGDAWREGALALSEAPLAPETLTPNEAPMPQIVALAESVHHLGRKAQAAQKPDARAELFGDTMATCAECHQWLGGGPPTSAP